MERNGFVNEAGDLLTGFGGDASRQVGNICPEALVCLLDLPAVRWSP
jgi:hypothetical protein